MNTLRTFAPFLLCAAAWGAVPPATGAAGGARDSNYNMIVNGVATPAFLVTNRPAVWGSQPGGAWIGPSADQSTGHSTSPDGNFTFELKFTVNDPSKANLTMSILSDPDVDIVVNGNFLPHVDRLVTTPAVIPITSNLVKGANKITFLVSDVGTGPVGFNVVFSGTLGDTGPALGISPQTLTFKQTVGTTSTQTVTMTSTGDANVNITNIKLNADSTGYSLNLTSCLGANLAPGSSCTLPITYTPVNTVDTQYTITVTSNAVTQPITLITTATAPTAAKIAVTPTQVAFKDTVVGTNSVGALVQVGNIGTAPLGISAISVDNPGFFLDTSACVGKTLLPGTLCLLGVGFRPHQAGAQTGNVSFASSASNSATLTLSGRALGPKQCVDTDGDGLCDFWETDGVHVSAPDGTDIFIDLPAMGADPLYKDIFIQIDSMLALRHYHFPRKGGMQLVQAAFLAAPVDNPNGQKGINVHIDGGQDSIMDARTGKTWGSLSRAASLKEVTPLFDADYSVDKPPPYDWTGFDNQSSKFNATGRQMIFHHVIYAHDMARNTSTSGISRNDTSTTASALTGASDFIVSLGSWKTDSDIIQGGTLMHELGHNLGLLHGGPDFLNYKPNYLSVMNYNFQTVGLGIPGNNGALDYSRFALPSLNENDLSELVGLNSRDVAGYSTSWFCAGDDPLKVSPQTTPNANGYIDWNCDGLGRDGKFSRVATNINGDYGTVTDAAGNVTKLPYQDVLVSQNDWSKLVFTGGAIGGLATAPPKTTQAPHGSDLTAEEAVLKAAFNQIRMIAPPIVTLAPGGSAAVAIVVSNTAINPETLVLTAPAVAGWISAPNLPPSLDIAGGANVNVPITLTAPASAKVGDTQFVTILAASKVSAVRESAVIQIQVVAAPDPITFSSQNLNLGSFALGTQSYPTPVTVTNTGTAAITLSSFAAAGDFAQINNCGASLAVGTSCTIQITFTPSAAGARTGAITLTDSAAGSPHAITVSGIGRPKPPAIAAVLHAASARAGGFAPGTLVSIYGTGLADQNSFITGVPLPTKLGGVYVNINGVSAPFTFAGPNQLNIQIPYELTPGTGTISVTASTGLSAYSSFDIVAASPGIFIIPGTQHAAAQNADFSTNLANAPVAPGGAVVMYFTGQGALDQTVATGTASPSSPLARVAASVTATVGGLPATVAFAGMTPGFAGLAQANIIVPATGADGNPLPAGDYPVVLTIGGIASNPANISVGGK